MKTDTHSTSRSSRSRWLAGLCVLALTVAYAGDAPPPPKKVAFLGVEVSPASDTLQHQLKLPRGAGLTVEEVIPASPAEQAGLRPHDVLERLDDQILFNALQLRALTRSRDPGQAVTLKLWRDGETKSVEIKLGETEARETDSMATAAFSADGHRMVFGGPGGNVKLWHVDPDSAVKDVEKRFSWAFKEARPGRPRLADKPTAFLGVQLKPADPSLAAQLGLAEGEGALVARVTEDSPAATAGLKEHDLLIELDGERIKGSEGLVSAIRKHKKGDTVTLQILRAGKRTEVKAILDERNLPEPEEVDRVMEELEDTLRNAPPGQRRMERVIIRDQEDEHGPATRTARESSVMVIRADDGVVTITRSGGERQAKVEDPDGQVIFEGPINTEVERERVPPHIRKRLEHLKEPPGPAGPSKEIETIELRSPPPRVRS